MKDVIDEYFLARIQAFDNTGSRECSATIAALSQGNTTVTEKESFRAENVDNLKLHGVYVINAQNTASILNIAPAEMSAREVGGSAFQAQVYE